MGGVNAKEGGESSGGRKSEALRKAVEDFLYRNHLPPFRLSDSLVKLGTLLRCHALVERTNIGSLGLRHHGNLARPAWPSERVGWVERSETHHGRSCRSGR